MNYIPLNFGLMSNPYNWINITLMVMIFGFGVSLVSQLARDPKPEPKALGA